MQLPPPSNDEDFECLCLALFRERWGAGDAQRYGKSGHAQHGVDFFGTGADGKLYGGQAKKREGRLRVAEVAKEIDKAKKFRPPLRHYVIATSAKTDPQLQRYALEKTQEHFAQKLFSVEVCCWDSLSDLLNEYTHVRDRFYLLGAYAHLPAEPGDSGPMKALLTSTLNEQPVVTAAPATGRVLKCPGQIIPGQARKALGIVSVSALALTAGDYQRIFPEINWHKELRRLRRDRLVLSKQNRLTVPTRVKRHFSSDDLRSFDQAWVTALDGQREHIDTAIMYALPCIGLGKIDDAVEALVAVVEATDLGWWGKAYQTVLQKLRDRRLYTKLADSHKAHLLNALGLCASHLGDYDQALGWFAQLRRFGRRTNDTWALGQSFINTGVVHAGRGNDAKAAMNYRSAVQHAKRVGDTHLLGRALNNLGLTIVDRSPEQAAALFREAIRAKKRAGDEVGLVASYIACGNLGAARGHHHAAMALFERGYRDARRLRLPHEQAILLNNIGSCNFDLGHHRKALHFYRKARILSAKQGISDVAILACRGEARACYDLGMFERAADAFLELASAAQVRGRVVEAIESFHAAGVASAHQGSRADAKRAFAAGLQLARKTKNTEWIAKCLIDECVTCKTTRLADNLLDTANTERRRSADVASPIYEAAVTAMYKISDAAAIEHGLRVWSGCARRSTKPSHAIEANKYLYEWLWSQGRFSESLRALDEMRRLAARGQYPEAEARAIDQKGVCLQELRRFKEAEICHRKALALFKSLKQQDLVENALNNLGELLRKTGKARKGADLLQEARRIAKSRGDVESEISIAHNLALAHEQMGDVKGGTRLLLWCSRAARSKHLHYEFVRSLHGLANAAIIQRDDTVASARYANALSASRKYGQAQQSLDIAINYAWFLRERLRYGRARQVLRKCDIDSVPAAPGRYLYHSLLARLHQDLRQWTEAEHEWAIALQLSTQEGAEEPRREAKQALDELATRRAEVRTSYADVKRRVSEFRTAAEQASFLTQQFEAFLKLGDERVAGKLFNSARQMMSDNGLHRDLVALHLLLGDAFIRGRYTNRLMAMKSYFAAMLQAIHVSAARMANIGVYINRKAIDMPLVIVRRLRNDVHRWLRASFENSQNVLRQVEWPLNMAVKITSANPSEVMRKDWHKQIVADELASWDKGATKP